MLAESSKSHKNMIRDSFIKYYQLKKEQQKSFTIIFHVEAAFITTVSSSSM